MCFFDENFFDRDCPEAETDGFAMNAREAAPMLHGARQVFRRNGPAGVECWHVTRAGQFLVESAGQFRALSDKAALAALDAAAPRPVVHEMRNVVMVKDFMRQQAEPASLAM